MLKKPKFNCMKKCIVWIGAVVLFASASFVILTPSQAFSQKDAAGKSQALPDSINNIVKISCFTCHSSGGNGMAASHVNFSKWETLTADKQASKAGAICKMVSGGKMPPKKFKESHPEAVLTPAQVKTICNWANSLKK
jgi:hypothetical protein